MRKDQSQSTEPKGKYRVTNWPEYNAGLICRGDITLWIDPDVFQAPAGKPNPKGGHPFVYADPLIQMLLTLKQMWRLPLRALQGFAQSLSKLAYPDLRVPNYTTLSRRAQSLHVVLPRLRSGAPMHLVVDSTGLKVYGEGEWKVRMHGYSKRRTWRKVHLAMDANTGMVQAVLMSSADIDDASVLLDLLAQIPPEIVIETVGADGAYDTKKCHELIEERGATPSIPPREGAVHWPQTTPGAKWRNAAVDTIKTNGRKQWKKDSGYHQRSLVENLMYRLKTLTGASLWARHVAAQATEVSIRVFILNRMNELARPKTVRTA